MPWHAHKHTPHTHADPFKSLTLVTMHQRHIVYLSNQANSCTTEKHGSHFSFAQCPFELLSFFIKSFLFHLFFPLSSCWMCWKEWYMVVIPKDGWESLPYTISWLNPTLVFLRVFAFSVLWWECPSSPRLGGLLCILQSPSTDMPSSL